jgi:hypothetical protein
LTRASASARSFASKRFSASIRFPPLLLTADAIFFCLL